MSANILIVEDEPAIREMIAFSLARAGYEVIQANDVPEAQVAIADQLPDLILLDWMLPGTSGLDYARRLRREEPTKRVPIIMLTARTDETDKLRGLDTGADDYITKPFSTKELAARVRAVLRRYAPQTESDTLEFEGLRIDTASHRVTADGTALEMGPTEYRLLYFFMTNAERVFSRGQVLDRVWGGNVYVEERTVDVHIRRLRKALSQHGYDRYIQTVRGAGYRFSKQV
ncbi:MAG TPA: phosphate regulon transcriptional regulator PhoB [Gammaproteobacteria bacterium]|nr:phosphate regulon transcriptional regulator PhoB [Gammaproteobacteria bacterium]